MRTLTKLSIVGVAGAACLASSVAQAHVFCPKRVGYVHYTTYRPMHVRYYEPVRYVRYYQPVRYYHPVRYWAPARTWGGCPTMTCPTAAAWPGYGWGGYGWGGGYAPAAWGGGGGGLFGLGLGLF